MAAETVSLRITLRYKDADEFAARFAENVSSAGLFLRTRTPKPNGTKVRFDLLLADGSRALRGEGVVVTVRHDDKPGMALRFNLLDQESYAIVERIVAKHGQGPLAPTPLATPFRRGSSVTQGGAQDWNNAPAGGWPGSPSGLSGSSGGVLPRPAWSNDAPQGRKATSRRRSSTRAWEATTERIPVPSASDVNDVKTGEILVENRAAPAAEPPTSPVESPFAARLPSLAPNFSAGVAESLPIAPFEPEHEEQFSIDLMASAVVTPVRDSVPAEPIVKIPAPGDERWSDLAALGAASEPPEKASGPTESNAGVSLQALLAQVASAESQVGIAAATEAPADVAATLTDGVPVSPVRMSLSERVDAALRRESAAMDSVGAVFRRDSDPPAKPAGPESKAEAKTEPKPEPTAEPKPEAKAEAKTELQAEPSAEPSPEPSAERRSEPDAAPGDRRAASDVGFTSLAESPHETSRDQRPNAASPAPSSDRSDTADTPDRKTSGDAAPAWTATTEPKGSEVAPQEDDLAFPPEPSPASTGSALPIEAEPLSASPAAPIRGLPSGELDVPANLTPAGVLATPLPEDLEEEDIPLVRPVAEDEVEAGGEGVDLVARVQASSDSEEPWPLDAPNRAGDLTPDEFMAPPTEDVAPPAVGGWSAPLPDPPVGSIQFDTEPPSIGEKTQSLGRDPGLSEETTLEDQLAIALPPPETAGELAALGNPVPGGPGDSSRSDGPEPDLRETDDVLLLERSVPLGGWTSGDPVSPSEASPIELSPSVASDEKMEIEPIALSASLGQVTRDDAGTGPAVEAAPAIPLPPSSASVLAAYRREAMHEDAPIDSEARAGEPNEMRPADGEIGSETPAELGAFRAELGTPRHTTEDLLWKDPVAPLSPPDEAASTPGVAAPNAAVGSDSFDQVSTEKAVAPLPEAKTDASEPREQRFEEPTENIPLQPARAVVAPERAPPKVLSTGVTVTGIQMPPDLRAQAAEEELLRSIRPAVTAVRGEPRPEPRSEPSAEAPKRPEPARAEAVVASQPPPRSWPPGQGPETDFSGVSRVAAIDLGGAYLRAGFLDGATLQQVRQAGSRHFPALVGMRHDRTLVVGSEARLLLLQDPRRVVAPAQVLYALRGSGIDPEAAKRLPATVTPDGRVRIELGGAAFELSELLVALLRPAVASLQEALKASALGALFSVPHGLDLGAQERLREAAKLAGISACELVSQVNVAIRAFDIENKPIDSVLLVDFGATHLGLALARRGRDGFGVAGTRWHGEISSRSLDAVLVELALEQVERLGGPGQRSDPRVQAQVVDAAQSALARVDGREANVELRISLPTPQGSNQERVLLVAQADVISKSDAIVDLVASRASQLLQEVGVHPRALGAVVLAGSGGTYPPLARKLAAAMTKRPLEEVPPGDVFITGLARMADLRAGPKREERPTALGASIGIGLPGGRVRPLIKSGSPLPTKLKRKHATTRDNQTELELTLYQGESEGAAECTHLGSIAISGLPKAERGTLQVDVEMQLDEEAVLAVTLNEENSGRRIRMTACTSQTPQARRQAQAQQPSTVDLSGPAKVKPPKGLLGKFFGR